MKISSKYKIAMSNGQNVIIDGDNNIYGRVDFK